jgi:hypothetical protein
MSNPPIDFAIIPDALDSLAVSQVRENEALLGTLWQTTDPQADVNYGAFHNLVVRPAATLLEVGKEAFATARKSSSFTALLAESTELSDAMLDELALMYRIQRKEGERATGIVRIIVREDVQTAIGSVTVFTIPTGRLFYASSSVTALASTDTRSLYPNGVLLRRLPGTSYYYFDVPVIAELPGLSGNLVKGAEINIAIGGPGYFVRAVALETFSGGTDNESNEALIQRMQLGISAKTLGSRINMKAALLDFFPDVRDSSVIGAGDIELTRDKHSVFPGSSGGFVDWYVGTSSTLATMTHATTDITELSSKDGQSEYVVYITDEQIPCLYEITQIQVTETQETCLVGTHVRHVNQELVANLPIIHDPEEAAFTAYQTTEVRFTGPSGLKQVTLFATHAAGIKEIQDWSLQRSQTPLGLDVLVKAAIPTTIRFSCSVNVPLGYIVDYPLLQSSVANYVNALPFNGLLSISGLTALLHSKLPANSYIARPALYASTLLPNGRKITTQTDDALNISYRKKSELELTYQADEMPDISYPAAISNRTTLFFCNPADVSFTQEFNELGDFA